ncbi:putative phosphoesterase [Salsuginibacillus halophilus]|uniref:Phosphoesterase n=1 Tax=Salsuginibacillus halophilus TaxID=517424 RepID=A0A2P8HWG5_9BACI|nr:metallophosphoesterase family protein [Salsuginibacillus halophilus]PSL50557.1 putative phosphoesterase [Salsuginibacillus halophilus]
MKIAWLSDIHGNARALKAVLNDIEKQQVNEINVLGDLVFRGPEPKNALETVRSLPAGVIQGNADLWVVRGIQNGEVPDKARPLMQQENEWTVERLTEDDLNYLERLPHSITKDVHHLKFHAFHAIPGDLFHPVKREDSTDEKRKFILEQADADVYIYGHVHTPYVETIDDKTLINTGSVGLPFDGDSRPSYVITDLSDGKLTTEIRRVDYDYNKVLLQYDANDYPNSEQMKSIISTGRIN